jgi:hypothetical protein
MTMAVNASRTFSVKQVIILPTEDRVKSTKGLRSHYITLASGVSWLRAKEVRQLNRDARIVPDRATKEKTT